MRSLARSLAGRERIIINNTVLVHTNVASFRNYHILKSLQAVAAKTGLDSAETNNTQEPKQIILKSGVFNTVVSRFF